MDKVVLFGQQEFEEANFPKFFAVFSCNTCLFSTLVCCFIVPNLKAGYHICMRFLHME